MKPILREIAVQSGWLAVAWLALLAFTPARGQAVRVDGATGVAVRIGNETNWLVTCQHGNVQVGEVYSIADEGGKTTLGTVVAIGDEGADCALIRTDKPAIKFVDLADVEPSIGEQVTLCGYTMGGPLQCKIGHVTGYNGQLGEARGVVNPGDSGGPILNTSGKLVGILSGLPGGPMIYCRLYCIKRMLDQRLPGRPAWFIGHAPRPQLPPPPSVYQQPAPVQQPIQTQQPPTYAGGQSGPAPGTPALDAIVDEVPPVDAQWMQDVDTDLERLQREKQDAAKFDEAQQQIGSDYQNLMKDVHAPDGTVANAIKTKLDSILGEVDEIAGKKIDEKLKPIDVRLTEVKQSLAVQVFGAAATFFGWEISPAVLGAGAMLGGPVGVAAAGLGYWLIKRRLGKKQPPTGIAGPGAGGAGGSGQFR